MVFLALGIGMLGYHGFEGMSWIDSFANAAMILSGMGPLTPLSTTSGKVFAGFYALFSGLVFIAVAGILRHPERIDCCTGSIWKKTRRNPRWGVTSASSASSRALL